jgi:hypothetical protein
VKRVFILLFILMISTSQLWAQQYLTTGLGYTIAFLRSEDLSLFKKTYNSVQAEYLYRPLQGFWGALGVRGQITYRKFDYWNLAIHFGYQSFENQDASHFWDGYVREIRIQMKSVFFEFEYGRRFRNYFVNGVTTFYYRRRVSLESAYNGSVINLLDGKYKGFVPFSADVGIAVGIYKNPLFLVCKITYPLFTMGKSIALRDDSIEKLRQEAYLFPSDYEAYFLRQAYQGISSNIDGLKILFTAEFAFRLTKGRRR